MINDIILKDTRKDEWSTIRERIKARISKSLGETPGALSPAEPRFEELEQYENFGFTHIKIKYSALRTARPFSS